MKRRTTTVSALATLVAGAALALLPAHAAQAHPLGNFTVNQYDGLLVAPGKLNVDHVEDLAEIPAAQEQNRIDADGDDRLASAELSAWARTRCDAAAQGAQLVIAGGASQRGKTAPVSAGSAKAQVRPGQAGLQTLRVICELTAPLPRAERMRLAYRPASVTTGAGWREITARGDRMTLSGTDVPGDSVSRRLTVYPGDPLFTPPDVRSGAFTVRPGGPALAGSQDEKSGSPTAGVLPRGADRWAQTLTGLVARHELTVGFAALALGASLLLGALHALAPGHGKTMMAAAATAGGRSSLRDVLALGISVTMTHTLGVFALGALIAAGSAAAPTVVSWLGVASGTLVAGAGALLLRKAWRQRHRPHGHSHGHTHGHTHGHAHEYDRTLADHRHEHGTASTHSHSEDHGHGHSHSHVPPAPGLRGVILLGFAGGLVPSPSAVLVLVGAAALGQAWFGFLLVLAYGAGLALTLTGAGFAAVRLSETTTRRLTLRPRGRFFSIAQRAAPLGTAAVVFALGCGLLLRGAATALS
ncbi:sulfite exporter TauE/SafE family protein [Streptomyces spiramyceticus]|uniref:urease accessory protein UreH domain-containing protein n=1 Tax=Streptomyces spiramyceticus TaxID=299717 RepID=UPI00237B9275|nr:sulfite exporter TauE/SafE family protein [Streptomyces spiramyceticus]